MRTINVAESSTGGDAASFEFARVFGPDSEQAEVYRTSLKPLVHDAMDGFNW